MTSLIPLHARDGRVIAMALVDTDDFEQVREHRWYFDSRYPAAKIGGKPVRLHRFLMGEPPCGSVEVDHENRNPLDNHRPNLRWATHAENGRNVPSQAGTSTHRGVTWDATRQRWKAQAKFNYRYHFLSRYEREEDAAAAVERFWKTRWDGGQPAEASPSHAPESGETSPSPLSGSKGDVV